MVDRCKNLLQVGFYTVTLVLPANLAVLAIVHVALLAITKIVKTDRTHEEAQKNSACCTIYYENESMYSRDDKAAATVSL